MEPLLALFESANGLDIERWDLDSGIPEGGVRLGSCVCCCAVAPFLVGPVDAAAAAAADPAPIPAGTAPAPAPASMLLAVMPLSPECM